MSFREERYETWLTNASACKKHFAAVLAKGVVSEISEPPLWGTRHLEKANHNLDFATLISDVHRTIVKERFSEQTFYDWATVAY